MNEKLLAYVEATLKDEAQGPLAQAMALDTLCDIFMSTDSDLLLLAMSDVAYLATRLPALVSAAGADQGDVPLLAARAIAQAVDVVPEWAHNLAQHGAVQALLDRLQLLPVDNIEIAEECLRALNLICMACPDECLRLGVAAALPHNFDYFSTRMKKVALYIVAQLIEDCDEADVPKAMEAAPAICNLLQSADTTIRMLCDLLQSAATTKQNPAISFLDMLASSARNKAQRIDCPC